MVPGRPVAGAALRRLEWGQVVIFHYSEEELLRRPRRPVRRQPGRVGARRLGRLRAEAVVEALAEHFPEEGAVRGDGVEVDIAALVAGDHYHAGPGHDSAGGIGAVR